MSKTIVTIHYQSPAADPLKVPRPTRISLDDAGNIETAGGEGELQGDHLIGFSRQDGPPETFTPRDWLEAEELISEGVVDVELAGWFPCFLSDGAGIYTWSGAVDRVEVTVK